jgi:hypothetical protein
VGLVITGYTFGSGMAQCLSLSVRLPGVGPALAGTAGGLISTLDLLGAKLMPAYVASTIANGNRSIFFLILGIFAIPWMIGILSVSAIQNFHTNTEASAGRFGFLKWWVPLHVVFALGLLAITGYGYFTAYLPSSWCDFLATHNFTSLKSMLVWFTATTLIKTAISLVELMRQPSRPSPECYHQ